MNCDKLKNGICQVATELVNIKVKAVQESCTACQNTPAAMNINHVTIGLAISELANQKLPIPKELMTRLTHATKPIAKLGVGTELKKLISWFPIPKQGNCRSCRSLEVKMNRWGPEACEAKISYILRKLRIAAARRSIPFSESLTKVLVRKAIRNAR